MIPYYLKFICEYSVFSVANLAVPAVGLTVSATRPSAQQSGHRKLAFTVGPPSTSHGSRAGRVSVPRLPHSNSEEFTHFRKPNTQATVKYPRCWVVFPGLELQPGFLVLPPLILALPFESHRKRYLSPPAHENLLHNLWLYS